MACSARKAAMTVDVKVENTVSQFDELLVMHRALYHQVCQESQRLGAECAAHKQLFRPWCPVGIEDRTDAQNRPTKASPEQTAPDRVVCEEVHLANSVLAKAVRARSAHKKSENNKVLDNKAQADLRTCEEKRDKESKPFSNSQHAARSVSMVTTGVTSGSNSTARLSTVKQGQLVSSKASKVSNVKRRSNSASGSKSATSVPVHSRAPFKTEPDRPRRPLSRNITAKEQTRNKGICATATVSLNKKSGRPLENTYEGVPNGQCSGETDNVTREIKHSMDSVDSMTSSLQSLNVSDHTSVPDGGDVGVKVDTYVQPVPQEDHDQSKIPNQTSTTSPPKTFNLLEDGCKLTIPSHLRKLTKQNHLLQQKLRASSLTTKVDFVSHRDQFLERLETETDVDERVRFGSSVHRMTVLHKNLQRELSRISDSPLTDSMPAADVLRKRMVLEMVLQSYGEVGQEVAALTKGENLFPGDVIYPLNVEVPLPITEEHTSVGPSISGCLEYHKERDLLRLAGLQHRMTSLLLEAQVVSKVSEVMLPLLHSAIQSPSASVVSLYRATFSLLSHPGHQLPTVVQDSTEDS